LSEEDNNNSGKNNPKDNTTDFGKQRKKALTDRLVTLRERSRLLELELNNYTDFHFRTCIFGSARIKPDDAIYKQTFDIAKGLGKQGIDVLTGGGPGLMEAANKGLLAGKEEFGTDSLSFGITIELNKFEEEPSEHLEIKHHHRRFSSRLDDFMRLSHAIIVVRGGIGTLLELYFSWQLLQVGHMKPRPIILVDKGFWTGLLDWMKEHQVGNGLVSPGDLDWIHLVDSPEEALELISKEHKAFIDKKRVQNENSGNKDNSKS